MRQGASCKTFSNGPAQRSSPSVTLGNVGFGMVIRNCSSLEGNHFCPPPLLHCSNFGCRTCHAEPQHNSRTFIWWIYLSMHFFQNIKDVPIFYMVLYVCARHPHCLCNYRSGLPGGHGHSCRWFPELPGKRHSSPFAPGTATAANAVHIAINLGSSVLVGPNTVTWRATLRICRDMAEYKITLWMLLGFRDWKSNLEIASVIWMQSSAYLWRCFKLLCHVLPNIWCKKLVQIWWESVTTPCFYWPIAWTSSWSSQGADRPRE